MQAGCDWTCLQMLLFKLFPDELERTTELVCIGGDMESLRQWWHASERAGCWCVGAQASGVQVASFWPGLFVSAMQGQDMAKLVCSLPDGGSGGGGGGGGDAAPAAAAAGKAPEGEPDHLNPAWRARQHVHIFGLFSSTFIDCALLALHTPLSGACAREWTHAGTHLFC
jgi:ribosomal protein L12E/L44/L45/RPP1/RPP2